MNVGIDKKSRDLVSKELSIFLANSYLLYMKTHGYHWNVKGPMFLSLHTLFMTQYQELWLALDEIAERIRALDSTAPYEYKHLKKLSSIQDGKSLPEAIEMVQDLLEGQETIIKSARNLLCVADKARDDTTMDLVTGRLAIHEKNAWVLRSILS